MSDPSELRAEFESVVDVEMGKEAADAKLTGKWHPNSSPELLDDTLRTPLATIPTWPAIVLGVTRDNGYSHALLSFVVSKSVLPSSRHIVISVLTWATQIADRRSP